MIHAAPLAVVVKAKFAALPATVPILVLPVSVSLFVVVVSVLIILLTPVFIAPVFIVPVFVPFLAPAFHLFLGHHRYFRTYVHQPHLEKKC